jgi:hypothetical protein
MTFQELRLFFFFQVETVSLAFDFLKDETGSIFRDNDGNIEHLDIEQQDKQPIFRFRPPQITAITKCVFSFKFLSLSLTSRIENYLHGIIIMN